MTTIVLDAHAVQALFPEGTEARVQLQNTVLRKIAEQHIKNANIGVLTTELRNELKATREAFERERRNAIDQAIAGFGTRKGWGGMELNAEVKVAITYAVKEAVGAHISTSIKEIIDARLEKISGTIAHDVQAAVNRATDAEIQRVVRDRIQSVIEKLGTP